MKMKKGFMGTNSDIFLLTDNPHALFCWQMILFRLSLTLNSQLTYLEISETCITVNNGSEF